MNNIKFSIYEGGVICSDCFTVDPFSIYINKEIYEAMYGFLYTPLEKVSDIIISKDSLYKLHEIIVEYILYSIDRKKFNALSLIKSLW